MALKRISSLSIATLGISMFAVASIGQAQAADMPDMPGLYTPEGPANTLSWAGSYVGLQVGAGQMAGEVTATTKSKFDRAGAALGVYAGHNWDVNRFVLGLEGDLTYMGNKKRFNHATLGNVKAENRWSASMKARVGLPVGRFMPYLSAGVTAADYKLTANGTSKSSTNVSLNLGGGVEYALSEQLRLRADYTLHGLNGATETFGGTRVKNESGAHRLMVGLTYAF